LFSNFIQKKGIFTPFLFLLIYVIFKKLKEDSMKQMDLFYKNEELYLYGEIEKLKNSTDRRCRAIFSLLTELQDQVLSLKNNEEDKNG